ncbi:ribosomal protein S6 kinase delta-1 isoform X1 [Alosa sapidissima]|uniref:ribosomal protein S6 kinase delta-1 isoform X1 n=2 Tax=Alosa sapidissima TaxID=34773 RepID=UPI001C0949D3|nr:ribosomal protein S6 kinase delta-1 isoform X1 [Alosa sapidissima]
MAKRDYLLDAARQIRMALDREVSEDYEAAFNYYKKGVDLLLNGIQVDPNKEQREAVKRKTTQYLKRAEEIFISHLQNNYQKGGSQMEQGYSSLRFRPIRHLNSPVEDLKMYKVVGIIDKVLTVQSLVCKDTFVIKSLPKSSGNCRDRPTIIPQNVPCMVKLLRYYVSEDAVYLHLDHVKGGKLFSKLHKLRGQTAKEHPECCSQHKIGLKNSYTSPAISTEYGQDDGQKVGRTQPTEGGPAVTTSPASWYEAQQRLENCQTHSYSEETGCLQLSKLEKLDAKLNRELSLHAKTPRELSTSSSEKNHSFTMHLSTHSDQQRSPSIHSEPPINDTGPDKPMYSSELGIACNSSDPLHKCGACMTPLHSGSNYAVDNVQTSLEHPLSTAQRQTSNDEVGTTAAIEPASFSREMDSETKGEAINPRCNKTSSSGNVCSQIVLSSDDFSMQHLADPAVRVSGEVSEERLQKQKEERKGDLGSVDGEKLQKAAHESGLGSPSSSLTRDTHSPNEMEDLEIEVDGWFHVPQFKKQVPRMKSPHGHWGLPEAEVCTWGAQILVALESLHEQGIICCDLNPNNILLSTHSKVCLTYFGQWSEVQPVICPKAMEQMYCAPEIGGMAKITEACDWWSLGALLFELLTGMPLWQCHPTGVDSHTQLLVPDHLSTAAASLLTELLQFDAGYRLGSGGGGVSDIKCHPFFHSVVWPSLDS